MLGDFEKRDFFSRACQGKEALIRFEGMIWLRSHPFSPSWRSCFSLVLSAWLLTSFLLAAEPVAKNFDIPAGAAEVALKAFSTQAGVEVVFSTSAVRRTRTNEVKGRFSPRQALDQMVRDTGLSVEQDAKTGALIVARTTRNSSIEGAAGEDVGAITGRIQNFVSGRYLANARVSIRGTLLSTQTDETGAFHLRSVPTGSQILEVYHTGMQPLAVTVDVRSRETLEQTLTMESLALAGSSPDRIRLDPFVTLSTRETDAGAIAVNEQRFSGNIKNVVATDAYGDVIGGNVGDFLKYIPGVLSADPGSQPEPTQISLRGFSAAYTGFSMDGSKLANANSAGDGRAFELNQSSIASIARVEVTKVPTPSDPADSMAGSINLISKSAFERSRAELRYRIGLTSNSESFGLDKQPDQFEKERYRIFPSFEFDYTLPVSRDFGLVVTALHSSIYYPTDTSIRGYLATGTGITSSAALPFQNLQNFRSISNFSTRDSISIKADWRVTPNSVLSAGLQTTYFDNDIGYYDLSLNTGNNGTPTILGGTPFTYGPDFTSGATGRGAVTQGGTFRHTQATTTSGRLNYRFDNGLWRVETSGSYSASRNWWRDSSDGFFSALSISTVVPVRVKFSDIRSLKPNVIEVFDNNNNPVDIYDPSLYRITGATLAPREVRDEVASGQLSVKRTFDHLPFPASLKVGGLVQEQTRDSVRRPSAYTYNPPNGDASIRPYLAQVFRGEPLFYGNDGRDVPWASNTRAWQAYQQNPSLFTQTPTQAVQAVRDFRVNSKLMQETVSALYVQGEAKFFRDRLSVLTGVRFEKTEDKGKGPSQDASAVFVRNADGSFALDSQNRQIRKPEAGAAGSREELDLTTRERAYQVTRSYDGYYPSLHLTYMLRDNFLLRAAYAKSFGRPDFSNIIPTITESQFNVDPTAPDTVKGTITLANTGLKPWTADNFDLSLEYYTKSAGVFSAGAFVKEIDDFFGSVTRIVTEEDIAELGLDSRYLGYQVTSQFNAGSARIAGFEVNANQSLAPLGGWGKYITVFANGTKLRLEGNQASSFPGFIPESANWGVTIKRRPYSFSARWNYRGKFKTATAVPAMSPTAFQYIKAPHPRLDINADYSLGKIGLVYLSVKNLFNVPTHAIRYGNETPDYAKPYQVTNSGVIFEVGFKGTF